MFKLAIVDDELVNRLLLEELLAAHWDVSVFESGEVFLQQVDVLQPDLVLLDIAMAGLDGYEVCRALQDLGEARPMVIFVSAHDTDGERLLAYQSGGEDFICKPFRNEEILHKVRLAEARQAGLSASREARSMAFSMMSSMGEVGVVQQFLRRSFAAGTLPMLADALEEALLEFRLSGFVDLRLGARHLIRPVGTQVTPLAESVLETVRGLGRLESFQTRAVVNYPGVSILVQNMPVADQALNGRLRDHLCMLAEGSAARLLGLQDAMALRERQCLLDDALADIRQVLADVRGAQSRATEGTRDLMEKLQETLEDAFMHLGLSDYQEARLAGMVRQVRDEALTLIGAIQDGQGHLGEALARLASLGAQESA